MGPISRHENEKANWIKSICIYFLDIQTQAINNNSFFTIKSEENVRESISLSFLPILTRDINLSGLSNSTNRNIYVKPLIS